MGDLPADARLGAIRLRVGDADRIGRFYEETIGLQALGRDGPVTSLGVMDGEPLVELEADRDAPRRPPHTTGLFHLAILLPTRADLAHALRRVAATGWRLTGASDHLVSEALYLSDPEGNGIELYRDRPRDEWPVAGGDLQMDTLPLDLGSLLSEADGADGETHMPVGTTLGHVHLQVADLDTAERFWAAGVGFDITVRGYPGALFVSAGGYHHHVGLNTWAGLGAPPPPDGAQGLDRFEIVLPDGVAVNETAERLATSGAAVELIDDGIVAADPSGNRVLLRTRPSSQATD
jgi:catechol 2,3-dioxygenase